MTPFVQPLDAGIICCFKAHYRALFCQRALELDTLGKENIFQINIYEAMLMAKEAGIQRDPIMLRIPARHGHEQTSPEAWSVLEDLATSRKTLLEAEDSLKKIYGSTYQDLVWRPALAAITGSETTDAALDELAKFKAAGMVRAGDPDGRRIFGPVPSIEDLVNPPGELEIGENPDLFESDADIVEVVRKGATGGAEDEDVETEVEECPPPQMSRPEMAELSQRH
jgi:hypothetical protein